MDDALALLTLQLEWGADESIGVEPVDRLRPVEASPVAGSPVAGSSAAASAAPRGLPVGVLPPGSQGTQGTPGSHGTPGERALALAGRAATLDELRAALAGFDGCVLRDTASNLVFAEGDPDSATLIIGEPPGREEDRSGHPFAGPEGQLLDQMLASIGLGRGELMLTPLLPWRPPGGRPPSPGEIAICLPFLHRVVALVKPRRIVLFGATAVRAMLPQSQLRRRGPRNWVEGTIPGMPAALAVLALPGLADMLKNPPLRRDAWAGLRLLRRAIDQPPTET
ncbi:uracil-DNA glycosylase [Rhodopila sp.]|uniref:uracil-DNA glycosylase n=1 Tax=Rhodopila sp. TaxID=2480087 RepID=UPI003D12D40C